MIDISKTIVVGKILGPFGIKGQLKITLSKDFENFIIKNIENIDIFSNEGTIFKFKISGQKNNVIHVFEEKISDRTSAENLGKPVLYCYKSSLPELEEDEYYYSDLLNSEVFDEAGTKIGEIISVNNFGAGDIIEIRYVDHTIEMIPFQKNIFLDVKDKKIIMKKIDYN